MVFYIIADTTPSATVQPARAGPGSHYSRRDLAGALLGWSVPDCQKHGARRRASTWPTERSCGAQTARHRATGNGGTVDSAPPVCATNLVTTLKPACLPSSERAAANRVLVVDTRGMSTTVAPGSSHQSWPERRVVVRSGSGPAIRAGWLQLSTRLHGFMFKISRFIARPLIRVDPLDVSRGTRCIIIQ